MNYMNSGDLGYGAYIFIFVIFGIIIMSLIFFMMGFIANRNKSDVNKIEHQDVKANNIKVAKSHFIIGVIIIFVSYLCIFILSNNLGLFAIGALSLPVGLIFLISAIVEILSALFKKN